MKTRPELMAIRMRLSVLEQVVNHLLDARSDADAIRASISSELAALEEQCKKAHGFSLMTEAPELWLYADKNKQPAEARKPHLRLVE